MKIPILALILAPLAAFAIERPLHWTADISRVTEMRFDALHGDALDFKVDFKEHGEPVDLTGLAATLYWQTNGMETAWWSTPGSVSNSTASALFPSSADPGCKTLNFYLCLADGSNVVYGATSRITFKNSPGHTPNVIEPPVRTLDFATIEVRNAPYLTPLATNELERTVREEINGCLSLGYGGTNAPTYKKVFTGWDNGKACYFILAPTGWEIDGPFGESVRLVNQEIRVTTNNWESYWSLSLPKVLQTDDVVPMSGDYLSEQYKRFPTSPWHVYQFLTSRYMTSNAVDAVYLKKADAADTYMTPAAADGKYSTPAGVASAIAAALGDFKPQYLYSQYGNYRLDCQGTLQRQTHSGYNVSWTNTTSGLVLAYVSKDKWHCDHASLGSLNFTRSGGQISCDSMPMMKGSEEYPGATVVTIPPLGRFFAYGDLSWEEYAEFVKASELDFTTNNATLVATIEATAPAPGDYSTVSNRAMTALQSYTESDPTVPAWAKASSKPSYTASEVGALPDDTTHLSGDVPTSRTINGKALSSNISLSASEVGAATASSVSTLSSQVTSIGAHLNAEDARFVSTNYNSDVHMPEASAEVNISNEWLVIWREMTRWNAFTGPGFDWSAWCGFGCFRTNLLAELDQKADRAWGFYDSHTGLYAPEGYTQISSSNVLIAAGMGYQRTITAEGTYWVLTANEPYATYGISSNGFIRVEDADGNVQFEIVKGDKRTVPAPAGGVTVGSGSPRPLTISYPVESQPTLEVALSLSNPSWHAEADASCPAVVTWTGSSGAFVATVTPAAPATQLFVRATYQVGGSTYINNRAPVSLSGGIIYNGTLYMPTPNGNKLEFVAQ